MSVELDDRIRTLVRQLDEMAPMAPEFETLLAQRPEPARSRRLLIPVLVGAVALLAVALVQVAGRPNPPSSGAQLVPHSVARDLPADWTVLRAGENTAPSTPIGLPTGVAYATPEAPFGPVVAFFNEMGSLLDTNQPTVERTRPNGLRIVIGSAFQGHARWVDVETSPGSWVGFAASRLTDDELFQLAEQLIVDGTASRFDGTLSHGLTVASNSFQFFGSFVAYGADVPPSTWPTGLAMTTYGPTNGPADTSVSIFPASPDTRVMLGLTRDLTDLGNGTISATTTDDPATYIYAQRDGYEVWARSASLDPGALSRLVLSLSPASEAEWASIVSTAAPVGTDGAESPETTAVEYPADTEPEQIDSDTRSTVDLDYTPLDNGTMTATLPGDHAVSVHFEPIGRSLRVVVTLDDTQVYAGDLDVNNVGNSSNGNIAGDGVSLHVVTYSTTDPAVERISVIDGPTEYTAPYVTFDESSSVRVAVVVVPARAGRTTPPAIFNLDANGKNLGNI